jgi:hypothetical protein
MLERLIVLVEEPSMEATVEHLLPKLMNDVDFEIRRFQCKDDLLKNLPDRLCGYSTWLPENWAILVLVDRDDDDCLTLKQKLEDMAKKAGLLSKSRVSIGQRFQVANRIAIEELEAWFFGDWAAVQAAYPRVPATIPQRGSLSRPGWHSRRYLGGTGARLEASWLLQDGTAQDRVRPSRGPKGWSQAGIHRNSFRAFIAALSSALAH